MILSVKQKTAYLKGGGCSCPFCGSEDIYGGPFESDAGIAWQEIQCMDCEERWNDLYKLTDVEHDE